jgi:hypothetical protein
MRELQSLCGNKRFVSAFAVILRSAATKDLSSCGNSSNHDCSHATPIRGAGAFQLRNENNGAQRLPLAASFPRAFVLYFLCLLNSSASSAPRQLAPSPVVVWSAIKPGSG